MCIRDRVWGAPTSCALVCHLRAAEPANLFRVSDCLETMSHGRHRPVCPPPRPVCPMWSRAHRSPPQGSKKPTSQKLQKLLVGSSWGRGGERRPP
eukprot:7442487-Alexandrium_andersonii.AAC.1